MEHAEIREVARSVAAAAQDTGTGFLLARLVTDRLLAGSLQSDAVDFRTRLQEHAVDLLLRDANDHGDEDRALLQALALARDPGLPGGEVWSVVAAALDDSVEVGEPQQVALLSRLGRFIVQERDGDEPVYRLFHTSLRDELRRQIGAPTSERAIAAIGALVELRDRLPPAQRTPYLGGRLIWRGVCQVGVGDLGALALW
jgi:hypothetical protein